MVLDLGGANCNRTCLLGYVDLVGTWQGIERSNVQHISCSLAPIGTNLLHAFRDMALCTRYQAPESWTTSVWGVWK